MILQFDLLILALIVLCAFGAIMVKDLLSASIILGAYSFLMCLIWTEMGAVDVAFTEASVGAGISTVFMIAAVNLTGRRVVRREFRRVFIKAISLGACIVTGMVLIFAVGDFPNWSDPSSPASLHVSPHYITKTIEETSVPNIVTSVLADYRGFDTMFETMVIFAAGVAVISILRRFKTSGQPGQMNEFLRPYPDKIIRMVSRHIVPFMQLFALYVIAHGHHSPGGGFQGGVILGASIILLAISYNLKIVLRQMTEKRQVLLGNIGVFIYAGIGLVCLLLGAEFLNYGVLSRILPAITPIAARSYAILGIEIGVGIAVMAIMVSLYTNISSHGKHDKGL